MEIKKLLSTLCTLPILFMAVCSCSTDVGSHNLKDIEWKLSYYSKNESLSQINIHTTYVLTLEIVFEMGNSGVVKYDDLFFDYDENQFIIAAFPNNDDINYLRMFVTGQLIVDNAHLCIRIGSAFQKDIFIDIVDQSINSETVSIPNTGISGFESIATINNEQEFDSLVSHYPAINDYVSSERWNSTHFDSSLLVIFNFNYNVSDMFYEYKSAFIDNSNIYFNFYVETSEDPSFELEQRFYAISVNKEFSNMNYFIYKSHSYF